MHELVAPESSHVTSIGKFPGFLMSIHACQQIKGVYNTIEFAIDFCYYINFASFLSALGTFNEFVDRFCMKKIVFTSHFRILDYAFP